MKITKPHVAVVSRPSLDWDAIRAFLEEVGGLAWMDRVAPFDWNEPVKGYGPDSEGELLVEFGGRECYRSWDVGLNPNVTKVREDSVEYLENINRQAHGSVLQHANYSFILHNVTRVLTHEMVRHVAGTAFSQESMRYVRLTDIPVWIPDWAIDDPDLMREVGEWLESTERLQQWMTDHFNLDGQKRCAYCGGEGSIHVGGEMDSVACSRCGGAGHLPAVPMHEKKAKTSFMRRWSPQGVSTGMIMTANVRALRWIIERRTEASAEEEIRLVAGMIGECMQQECPTLFGDFETNEEGEWIPKYKKV